MVLEGLSSSLRSTLRKIANATNIDKRMIDEIARDIQIALITADVHVPMVKQITDRIKERALTEKPKPGHSSREHVIQIVYEELVDILGEAKDIPTKKQTIMMVGLYGQGKTTTAGKLALLFKRKGMKPGIIAGDIHRPAAVDQLEQLGKKVGVPVYCEKGATDAVKVVQNGMKSFTDREVIIIDTAGRHSLEDELIREMKNISRVAKADERFLVLDASVGQQAGQQARAFHDAVNITGVIITKLDGTAKGGGALSAVQATKAPVVYIGVGEHMEDIEKFNPPRFISRLLGMGDIETLLERATEVIDEEEAKENFESLMEGRFSLKDMYKQMESLKKMGPLSKVMDMLALGGMAKMSKSHLDLTQEKLARFKVIMDSMTDDELNKPDIIKHSRVVRIARGAGADETEVRELLSHYKRTKKMMKGMTKDRKFRRQMMKQMKDGSFNMDAFK